MQTVDEALEKLRRSDFRARFRLSDKDRAYVKEKGLETIRRHAQEIIEKRLSPSYIENDGRQTPMRGHPVFIAQHSCACCCRGCLEKWYKVPRGTQLTSAQQKKIVDLLMRWIELQMAK